LTSLVRSACLTNFGAIVAALLFLIFAFKVGTVFSRKVMLTWFLITPVALCLLQAVRLRTR
jgi:putative colanic acid biosysnthesis UDP-glucose lipid carrier transferase